MSSRNKAIKKAFMDAYVCGFQQARQGATYSNGRVQMELAAWSCQNDHLLDAEPDIEQIIRAIEAKLECQQEAST